jgi:hypothetical protein
MRSCIKSHFATLAITHLSFNRESWLEILGLFNSCSKGTMIVNDEFGRMWKVKLVVYLKT